jgi:hypothetical protein
MNTVSRPISDPLYTKIQVHIHQGTGVENARISKAYFVGKSLSFVETNPQPGKVEIFRTIEYVPLIDCTLSVHFHE